MNDRKPGADKLAALSAEQVLAILAPHLAGLKAYLRRSTQDQALAEDLLQDAVVTAIEKVRTGEISDYDRLAGYVYRVALNLWRNQRRKMHHIAGGMELMVNMADPVAGKAATESIQGAQWAKALRDLLAEMPSQRDRELIVRYYLEQEDKAVVCEALGLEPIHFNRVAFRARERLRALFEERGFSAQDLIWVALMLAGTISDFGDFT